MCGEMSGDVLFTVLLLGLGLRTFSITPALIPEVKRVVRSVSVSEAAGIAQKALHMSDPVQTITYLTDFTRRIAPDVF